MLDNVYYSKVLEIERRHFSNDVQCSGIQYSMWSIEARALLLWFGLHRLHFYSINFIGKGTEIFHSYLLSCPHTPLKVS